MKVHSFSYHRTTLFALLLLILCIACGCISLGVGSAGIPLPTIIDVIFGKQTEATARLILFDIRLPRLLLSFFVGASLSICGACMQGLFQNALADPHILGVSSGAAFGATIAITLGLHTALLGGLTLTACAFVGGSVSVLFVATLSRVQGQTSMTSLLLGGVAISSLLSSGVSAMMIANHNKMEQVMLWTMGSFASASWQKVYIAAPLSLLGAAGLLFFAHDLNAFLLGEAQARSLGVRAGFLRLIVLGLCTLLTSTAVSVSGIIGFVGLMVPHAIRMLTGPDHRSLLPLSFLGGGLFALIMDMLSRTLFMPLEIPVGILTALVGGPFFLLLLRRQKK